MKKYLFLFTILFFLLFVAGCDEDSKKHTHSYEATKVIEPTCAEEGYTIFECTCGDVYKDKYTQPTGKHVYGEWIIINEAESQNQGLRMHICEVCQHEETETYGHEHTWSVEWSYDENRHWISTNCTAHANLDSKDIGPHTFENGYCTVCNFEENTYGISFALHNDEYYSVWGQSTKLEEIFIPSEFRGKPVLEIDSYAFSSNDSITSVIISEGIQTIKKHAFSNCKNLTTITIPDSVISIEEEVFSFCSSLKEVKLPANLKNIPSSIFSYCVELENILLPDSILSIADSAFDGCSKLTSIDLPKNVKSIGYRAFSNCVSLQSVTLDRNVEIIKEYAFYNCEALEDVNYNMGLIDWCQSWCTIGFGNEHSNPMNYAEHFYAVHSDEEKYEITNITVPYEVKEIGEYQFTGFNNVTFIEVPNTVEIIEKYAFYNCNSLERIRLPFVGRSVADTEKTHFGYIFGATSFEYNRSHVPSGLKEVIITGGTSLKDSAFEYCSDIKRLVLPSTLNRIGSNVFISTDLEDVIFDGSLEEWCKVELHSTPIHDTTTFLVKEAEGVWVPPVNVVIPAKVKAIGDYQFCNMDSITSLEVLGDEISIGDNAFRGCKNLTNLILPANVTEKSSYAFLECYNITYAKIPTTVLSNINKIFLKEVEIIGGKRIEDYAFRMGKLEKITIAESVQFIGAGAFQYCDNLSSVVLPDSITSIGDYAFAYCDNLTEINLGNGVTSIGKCAFQQCAKLKNIVLPKSLVSIGDYAFSNCFRLVEIYNLSSLEITNEEGNIGQYAKVVHTTLEASNLIEKNDFIYIKDEKEKYYLVEYTGDNGIITLPRYINENEYEIIRYAFYATNQVEQVSIPYGFTSIDESIFYGCSSLKEASLPLSLERIESFAFAYCYNLTKIVLPPSLASISGGAFKECWKLAEIYNLSSLDIEAGSDKYGEVGLYAKVIHDNLADKSNYIYKDDFTFIKGVDDKYYLTDYTGTEQDIILPEDIMGMSYEISIAVFYLNDSIKSIYIPKSIKAFGDYAFTSSLKLSAIYYEGTEEEWEAIDKGDNQFTSQIIYSYVLQTN